MVNPRPGEQLAVLGGARTVGPVRVLTSTPVPTGHLVVVRLPEGAAVVLRYADGNRQDVTDWAGDLLLIGLTDAAEERRGEQLPPEESVEVARVVLEGGEDTTPASFTYLHLPSGDWLDLSTEYALQLLGRGVDVQITAGVAQEAADADGVPDDPGALDAAGE